MPRRGAPAGKTAHRAEKQIPQSPCKHGRNRLYLCGLFGTLQKRKTAWNLRLTTVCPTSTQNQEKLNRYPGVAQLGARVVWELKAANRSLLQKSEETREKRRKNEHLPFDLPPQKWFDHNFDQFCKPYIFDHNFILRGVAQLVARLVWDQDAAGSSPVTSTK